MHTCDYNRALARMKTPYKILKSTAKPKKQRINQHHSGFSASDKENDESSAMHNKGTHLRRARAHSWHLAMAFFV